MQTITVQTILLFLVFLFAACTPKKQDGNEVVSDKALILADSLANKHEYAEANKVLLRVLSAKDSSLLPEVQLRIFNSLAFNYRKTGEFDSAFYYARKALKTAKANGLANSLERAQADYILGLLFRDADTDSSKMYLERSLAIRKRLLGEKHPLIGDIYNNLGIIFYLNEDAEKALEYYKKAAELRKLRGQNHPSLGSTFMNMANVLSEIGDYSNALVYYDSALAIQNKIDSLNNPRKANILVNMAVLYGDLGDIPKSIEFYKKALEIYKNVYGENHPHVAVVYNNMATASLNFGDYETAVEYLLESVRIKENKKNVLRGGLLDNYLNLSETYYYLEDYDKALDWGIKGLKFAEENPDLKKQTLSLILVRLAYVYLAKGDTLQSMLAAENALKKAEEIYAESDFQMAQTFLQTAEIFKKAKRYDKAYEYADRADRSFSAMEKKNYFWLMSSKLLKAEVLFLIGNYEKSLDLLEEIEEFFSLSDGKPDENKISKTGFLKSYVNLNYLKAQNYFKLSGENNGDFLRNALSALDVAEDFFVKARKEIRNDKSKINFSKRMRNVLNLGIEVAHELFVREGSLKYFERALNFSEDGKSLLLLENISEKELLKIIEIPDSLLEKRTRLKAKIVNYERILNETEASGSEEKSEEIRNVIFKLKRELEKADSEIEKNYGEYSQFTFVKKDLTLNKIRKKALDEGQTIVEFFLTPRFLYAFVISETNYDFLKTKIDFNVAEYVNNLLAAIRENNKNNYLRFSYSIYKLAIEPLEKKIHTGRILIVNDGVLGYVPYDALLTEKLSGGSFKEFPYLIKRYSIGYAFSISVLLESRGENKAESFLGVAPLAK